MTWCRSWTLRGVSSGASDACSWILLAWAPAWAAASSSWHCPRVRRLRESCKGLSLHWKLPANPSAHGDRSPTVLPREFWDNVLSGLRQDKLGWMTTGLPFIFGPGRAVGDGDDEISAHRRRERSDRRREDGPGVPGTRLDGLDEAVCTTRRSHWPS